MDGEAQFPPPGPEPELAGAVRLPEPGASAAERRRARRASLFAFMPLEAFEEPVLVRWTPFGRVAAVNDPAAVKRVLVDEVAHYPKTPMEQRFFRALFGSGLLGIDGDLWRRHRRIMAPAFDPRSVASYGPAIAAAAAAFADRWAGLPDGAEVDMAQEMSRLTLEIIARTMFSTARPEVVAVVGDTMKDGLAVGDDFSLLDVLPVIGAIRMRRREREMETLFAPLDGMVAELIAEREAAGQAGPADLLARLVAAKDTETGAQLTAREVRDEVVTIFIAGHETTAVTLDWVWYALSQRPRVEARLHAELDAVLGGRPPTQDDLPRLVFARQVVEETMRLFPPAPGLSMRIAARDDVLGGRRIRKGTGISISPFVLHRHRRLWDDPETFDPDRFAPERAAGRPRFAYLPFGGGPRVCIGQMLAMNEAVLILAALAQHVRPRLSANARVELQANVTLRPRHGLPMRLVRRGG